MRFLSSIFAIVALVSAVMGAENPIIYPDGSTPMTAGKPFTIEWTPTTSGSVKFTLRQGPSGNLVDVEVIVSGAPNTGTYTWTPETSLPAGSDYAIMITDEQGNVNYTPLVTIVSDTMAVSSTSSSTAEPSSTTGSSPSSTKPSHNKTTDYSSSTTMESSTITPSAVMTGHGNSTTMVTSMTGTMSSNDTYTTGMYGNSTRSSATASGHSSASSTSTSTSTTGSSTTAISTGAAAGLLKSPLALVVCLIGAVVYLN